MTEKQPSDHDLLVRIEERTKSIQDNLSELKGTVYGNGKPGLKDRVQRIENVWTSLYGFLIVVSLILGSVSTAILIFKK